MGDLWQKLGVSKGSVPLFLLVALVLFVALILEVLRLTFFTSPIPERQEVVEAIPKPQKEKTYATNVFENIHRHYPSYKTALEQLTQDSISLFTHNPTLGNGTSPVRLVIFTDNDCAPCRGEVKDLLSSIGRQIQYVNIVVKFIPSSGDDMRGGIFDQLANSKGVFDTYFDLVLKEKRPLTSEDYLVLLEKAGVPLSEQRTFMANQMRQTINNLQQDIVYAQRKKLYGAPIFFINGYRLGQQGLPVSQAPEYVERLLKGQTIVSNE